MPDAETNEPCEFLTWDSEFWDFPVARVRGQTLTPERVRAIDAWCQERAITCLYFLADFDDPLTVHSAEDGGFHLVDCRVTATMTPIRHGSSECRLPPGIIIRPATGRDSDPLQRIARESYRDTRFYFDMNFPREKCGDLYARWIAESIRGYADLVLVADLYGEPAGYVTCKLPTEKEPAKIGLLNVAAHARRKGVGQELLMHALDWLAESQAPFVTAATQGRNVATQAVNTRCGFIPSRFELWYHKWYRAQQMKPL